MAAPSDELWLGELTSAELLPRRAEDRLFARWPFFRGI
jgi:hypothetical protein